MIALVLYTLIAVAVLVLAAWLAQERVPRDPWEGEEEPVGSLEEASFLFVAQRVFDPGDYRWLREELWFPQAAVILARDRKQLALKWLRALRRQFTELVRLPDPAAEGTSATGGPSSWRLLWLTLRFHFLLSYAILVVWLFGPYHRLVPSFAWVRSLSVAGFRKLSTRVLGPHHLA